MCSTPTPQGSRPSSRAWLFSTTIKRKYGGTLEAAIAERGRLESQLGATEDLDAAVGAADEVNATTGGRSSRRQPHV